MMKKVMNKPLSSKLKSYYQEKSLDESQLSQLETMINKAKEKNNPKSFVSIINGFFGRKNNINQPVLSFNSRMFPVGITAVLLVLVFVTQSLFNGELNIENRIANEIAYNHNKLMSPEVMSSSLSEIGEYLEKLDFSLVDSKYYSKGEWNIIGGRYCSINGQLAAQLKIMNMKSKQVHTFYQSLLPAELDDKPMPYEIFVDGVKVLMWKEKGLLMGLAG